MRQIHVLKSASLAILLGLSPLFGQGVTLVGSGYANPTSILVSPGQITTFFVSGLNIDPTKPQNASTLPLPISLAGISVTMTQSQSYAAPILAVQQLAVCSVGGGGAGWTTPLNCLVGAITLQVPYELSPFPALPPNGSGIVSAEVVISQNGVASQAFTVIVGFDNLHVLNTCDSFPPKLIGICSSVVTHADGTLVTADSPAAPGETVVIYAYGLGQTNPTAKTGQASPTPAALSSQPSLRFDFTSNAMPSPPFINRLAAVPSPTPLFAGLTPGQVGLYQINVTIPSTVPVVDKCGSTCSGNLKCGLYNIVTSNLTIDIGANLSWDGAAICVQPPQ